MSLSQPWHWIPANVSYKIGPKLLKLYGSFSSHQSLTWSPLEWKGLEFKNPLGLAGGVDKNADMINSWWTLGPGFVEVGTITPLPQDPNPGKVVDRDHRNLTLWNQLGFPNKGAEFAIEKLKALKNPHFTPIFANIGKNRLTKNEDASKDYVQLIQKLNPFVEAFTVNLSSPNTKGLRELLQPETLKDFLAPLIEASDNAAKEHKTARRPLLVKFSPDMEDNDFLKALEACLEQKIDGAILTNTTLKRSQGSRFPKTGGISGAPLAMRSKELLSLACRHLDRPKKDQFLLVSVGGILSPNDVFERLDLGAHLVQVYSALVLDGPMFFRKTYGQAKGRVSSH